MLGTENYQHFYALKSASIVGRYYGVDLFHKKYNSQTIYKLFHHHWKHISAWADKQLEKAIV